MPRNSPLPQAGVRVVHSRRDVTCGRCMGAVLWPCRSLEGPPNLGCPFHITAMHAVQSDSTRLSTRLIVTCCPLATGEGRHVCSST